MNETAVTRESFTNKAEIRWCPGCGDYAILMALQRALAELDEPPEKHVFVSGIGCAGRLPYYMNCYGFHGIHGRATAIATGLATLREDVHVWVITGDGDALSIGTNHLIHCLRRNVNLTILLFNNQVYGLTKGQFSPTSQQGQLTKTSPQGLVQEPLNPLMLALSAKASFVARSVDKDATQLIDILKKAHAHQGSSFVEIYQDCHIFNPAAFDAFAVKGQRMEKTLLLEAGKPLIFGREREWVLVPEGESFSIIPYQNDMPEALKHDTANFMAAMRLARAKHPELPVPLGVYYEEQRDIYRFSNTITKSSDDLAALFRAKASWRQTC